MRIAGTSTARIAAALAAAVLGVGAAGVIACGADDAVTTTEPEHADDPECAGGIEAGDDSSGPGSGGIEAGDDNSGPGSSGSGGSGPG